MVYKGHGSRGELYAFVPCLSELGTCALAAAQDHEYGVRQDVIPPWSIFPMPAEPGF